MLVRGVVDDEIDDDANAALLAAMGEFDEVAERAVAGIDAVIVGDVVAVVAARRGLERHQPDRGDAEAVQIIEPPQQALEVADAVAVGIHIGADGQAIDYAVLVPEVVDHAGAASMVPPSCGGCVISARGRRGSHFMLAVAPANAGTHTEVVYRLAAGRSIDRRVFAKPPPVVMGPRVRGDEHRAVVAISPLSDGVRNRRNRLNPPHGQPRPKHRPRAAAGPSPIRDGAGDRARAPRGCCARWASPASANCRCRRGGAPTSWR